MIVKRFRIVIGCLSAALFLILPVQAQAIQCVPFARIFSGIQLFGNAYSWWAKALGKYTRGSAPQAGAVLVFKAGGAMRVGHVATVTQVISDRIIKVTHANWSHGRIDRDVTVMDASAANDWSKVKVWFTPLHDLGTRAYPVYGFIYSGKLAKAAIEDATAAATPTADAAGSGDGISRAATR